MDAAIMRSLALIAVLLATGCSMTEKSHSLFTDKQPTLMGETAPGLGDLWAPTKAEKAEDDWWAGYYGNKKSAD